MASPTAVPFPFPGDRLFARNTSSTVSQAQSALGFSVVKVQLSSAQLLALQTTAVTLVPAGGSGFWYAPFLLVVNFQGGGTQYTDAGGAVSINCGSWTSALSSNNVFTTPTGTNRCHATFDLTGIATQAATPTNENAAITISKATNNFAAGNGTASVVLYYNIHESI